MTFGRLVISIGGAMQLVGVTFVFVQIRDVQKLLRGRSWTSAVADAAFRPFIALRNRVRPRKGRVLQLEASGAAVSTGHADVQLRIRVKAAGTTEERLEALGRQLEEHESQLESLRGSLNEHRADLAKRIEALQSSVNAEMGQIRRLIDILNVGSLRGQAVVAV